MKIYLLLLTLLGTTLALDGAFAQTPTASQGQPDPIFLQKAVQALQTQRNNEADQRTVAEARAAMLQDQVLELQKKVQTLQDEAIKKLKEEPAK